MVCNFLFPFAKEYLFRLMFHLELKCTTGRRRVGFLSRGPPARGHTPIYSKDGKLIGEITSGCPAPSLPGVNVSMGYVERPLLISFRILLVVICSFWHATLLINSKL